LLQAGSSSPDLSTPSGSETIHAIRLLYGHSIAKELLEAKVLPKNRKKKSVPENDNELQENNSEPWAAEAFFTNPSYQAKKMTFILFINRMSIL
jgi:DNA mismatch repair protein MLH1